LKAHTGFRTLKQTTDYIVNANKRVLSEELLEFLKLNLPINKKKTSQSFSLALVDSKYGGELSEKLNVQIQVGDFIHDIFRVIRTHYYKYLKGFLSI
jgi:hypothetical protein